MSSFRGLETDNEEEQAILEQHSVLFGEKRKQKTKMCCIHPAVGEVFSIKTL
jgi:hypothetical protein